ncbi:hypothetical protein WK26_19690 [Burkholderia vietnamiensis]|nr:hypothetical protein WK23_09725 [Burkholderia vietnamiensis]KVF04875.1 hypothetical protein WJ05_29260 [Burkholderia vietnamiensis]KVF05164.1 hypothetical protein WJ04_17505 [Burkholderia vietnamiensis]KVF37057.1 hypothetical protein WJ09_05865 [Burkholderia vietnamiensis]KVR79394.1 hypothetical protein WK26_19690 [Burkholderia vietnamiensis]
MILGVDTFLDMGRSVTNVVGNGIASEVVAKGEEEPMTESEALVHAVHFDAELERRNGYVGYGGGRAASV